MNWFLYKNNIKILKDGDLINQIQNIFYNFNFTNIIIKSSYKLGMVKYSLHLGDRGRRISVSFRTVWSTQPLPGHPESTQWDPVPRHTQINNEFFYVIPLSYRKEYYYLFTNNFL